jgi:predicted polyphosphate/ATP-dependent NAD kinase
LTLVGIIANPAASKDIRRLVAQGRVVPDWEKVNILRRVLLGLEAVGVERVVAMPDSAHLAARARDDAGITLALDALAMPATHSEEDTTRAAGMMGELGVQCLVTLGGDGTNRAAAKGCASIPVVAISTGTNNVFPAMVEGTLAGMAAGLVAQGKLDHQGVVLPSKTLEVYVDGARRDLALVDVAFSRERFVGARAIWDMGTLYEVFLTRAEPAGIGLSSVGARLAQVSITDPGGLRYVLGQEGALERPLAALVLAPVAPGVVLPVPIAQWQRLAEDEMIPLPPRPCTVALDGERAFTVASNQRLEVAVRRNGPPVVQVEAALRQAVARGLFAG